MILHRRNNGLRMDHARHTESAHLTRCHVSAVGYTLSILPWRVEGRLYVVSESPDCCPRDMSHSQPRWSTAGSSLI